MIEVGRLCIKTAGRDSRRKCVIVEILDDNFVTIDGDVRRKKCNIKHLEPLKDTIKIKKGADHKNIISEFKKLGIEIKEKKSKESKERPKKEKQKKEKPEKKIQKEKKKKDSEEKGLAEKLEKDKAKK
ncbi:50S ribosomal protein L14e [Candidatus Woesearchaeota archaeon]|nr:50S ribosomal protein L14e [Candidatus Woesearchaeota archaeon]